MARLTLVTSDEEVGIQLDDATLEPLLEELRIVSPLLAAKIQDGCAQPGSIALDVEEIQHLGAAAAVLDKGGKVNDPGLRLLARL